MGEAIDFRVIDADSEDLNGSGVLDAGEDADGDGELDAAPIDAYFEWAEFPATNPPPALSTLVWLPATPHASSPSTSGLVAAPPTDGREYVLVWDARKARPLSGTEHRVLLRVNVEKVHGPRGDPRNLHTPVILTFED